MTPHTIQPIQAGKFLITPFTRSVAGGDYAASVSVRRGQGRQTTDRVYTFKPLFGSAAHAMGYAVSQARQWLANPAAFA